MRVGHKSLVARLMMIAGVNLIYLFVAPLALPRILVNWVSRKRKNLSSMRKEPANQEKYSNLLNIIGLAGGPAVCFFLAVCVIPLLLISVIVEFEKWLTRIALAFVFQLGYLGIPAVLFSEGKILQGILFDLGSSAVRRTIKIAGLGETILWSRFLGFTTICWSRLHKPDVILRAEVLAAAIAINSDAYMRIRDMQISFSAKKLLIDIWQLRFGDAFAEESLCFELSEISIWSGSRKSFDAFRMINDDFVEPANKERRESPASACSIWSMPTAREVSAVVSLQEGRDLISALAYNTETIYKLRNRSSSSRSITHRGKRTLTVLLSALINLVASRVILGTWNAIGADDLTIRFRFAVLSLALTTIWLNILSKELFGPIKEDEEDVLRRTPNRRIVEILSAAGGGLSRTFESMEEDGEEPTSSCGKDERITLRHTPMEWMLAGLGIDEATGKVASLYGKETPYVKPPAAGYIRGLTYIDNSLEEPDLIAATDGDDLVDLDVDESWQVAQNGPLQTDEESVDSEFDSPV